MTPFRISATLLFPLALLPAAARAQAAEVTLPPGTQLPVKTPTRLPMRAGTPIRAELLYPVYAGNQLILPARTIVTGHVVQLNPDHKKRVSSRLRADFTPFRNPVVRFESILPPTGAPIPIVTGEATDGAPVYRITPTASTGHSLFSRATAAVKDSVRSSANVFLAPEKGDRFVQFIYAQLPYHPQRIAKDTAWTVETAEPLTLAAIAAPPPVPVPPPPTNFVTKFLAGDPPARPTVAQEQATWVLEAYLDAPISSETSHANDPIHATVAQPVFNPDGSIAVPQGAVLTGTVTQAKHTKSFDRAGILRFNFAELKLPDQEVQRVRTSIAGADSSTGQQLDMDAEGQVKPKPKDKIVTPLLLVFLASRPLDREHDGHAAGPGNMAGKDAAGSASLGLLSFIIGTAAQQPNLAAGLGYYSAALAIYPRYFGKGAPVAFPKDTRIIIRTTPTKSQQMHAAQ